MNLEIPPLPGKLKEMIQTIGTNKGSGTGKGSRRSQEGKSEGKPGGKSRTKPGIKIKTKPTGGSVKSGRAAVSGIAAGELQKYALPVGLPVLAIALA